MYIGELSRRTGCNVETIRYYERARLIPRPNRTASGYRTYGEDHVRRLRFVRRCRGLGFSLDEIRGLLALADQRQRSCEAVNRIASTHLVEVHAKLAQLRPLERELARMVRACAGGQMSDCRILDALSHGEPELETPPEVHDRPRRRTRR